MFESEVGRGEQPLGEVPRQRGRAIEIVLLMALLVAAAAIRWPYLVQIPQLTDETIEIGRALDIARGEKYPLTNYVAFTGPVFHYLLAAAFKLFGESLQVARGLVLVVGCLSVLATYALGKTLANPRTGLLAGLFMATSSVATVASSHLAWSHSTTTFFVAIALWQIARAARSPSRRRVGLAALLVAVALQTHPSVLLLLPGVAVFILGWSRPALTRSNLVAATVLFLVGYANMITYNASRGFDSLGEALAKDADYSRSLPDSSRGYVNRFREIATTLARLPGSRLDEWNPAAAPLNAAVATSYLALSVGGLVILARCCQPLPVLASASLVLLLPFSSAQHADLPRQGRYLAPILPLLFIGLATLLLAARSRLKEWAGLGCRQPANILYWLVITGLVLAPLEQTWRHYESAVNDARTNERFFEAVIALKGHYEAGATLLLDEKLIQERTNAGGSAHRAIARLLDLDRISAGLFDSPTQTERSLARAPTEIVLLSPHSPAELERRLQPTRLVAEALGRPAASSPYFLYRLRLG